MSLADNAVNTAARAVVRRRPHQTGFAQWELASGKESLQSPGSGI
jgi:hypothetical protein